MNFVNLKWFVILIFSPLMAFGQSVEGLRLQDSGTPKANVQYDLLNDVLSIISSEIGSQMSFSTNNVERVRIDDQGNVGVGTTSPQTLLDVAGTLRLADGGETCVGAIEGAMRYNSSDKRMELCDGSDWLLTGGAGSVSTVIDGWPDAILCESGSSRWILYHNNSTGTAVGYHAPGSGAGSDYYIVYNQATGNYGGNAGFSTLDCVTNSWSIADLKTEGRTFNFVGGNGVGGGQSGFGLQVVAEGTVSVGGSARVVAASGLDPAQSYDVVLSTDYTTAGCGYIYSEIGTDGSGNTQISLNNNASCGGNVSYKVVRLTDSEIGGGTDDLGNHTATQNIDLSTHQLVGNAGSQGIAIDSGGNVGIGTTSPIQRLQVEGAFHVGTSAASINAAALSGLPTIYGWNGTTNNAHLPLSIRSTPGTQLYLNTDGNVGIGMTNPSNALHVTGNIGATGWIGAGCEGSCSTSNYVINYADGRIVTNGGGVVCSKAGGSATFSCSSDERLKNTIESFHGGLDFITALRPTTYYWNSEANDQLQYGFIAQEVQHVIPHAVSEQEDESGDEYLSLDQGAFTPYIINAIKQLNEKITQAFQGSDELAQKVDSLESENAELRQRLERLESRFDERAQ